MTVRWEVILGLGATWLAVMRAAGLDRRVIRFVARRAEAVHRRVSP